jgi:hypothetical protein
MKDLKQAATVRLVAAGLMLAVAGCGSEPAPSGESGGAAGAVETDGAGSTGELEMTFSTMPDPPASGENTLEVVVVDADGRPVADAEVSVAFYMAGMPEMKMPEMRNTATLVHEGGGRYRGTGQVMMAGPWEVTVTAMRDGREIARHVTKLTAAP